MKRELSFAQQVERSITKKYRKEIWNPFIAAVKRYELIDSGDNATATSRLSRFFLL